MCYTKIVYLGCNLLEQQTARSAEVIEAVLVIELRSHRWSIALVRLQSPFPNRTDPAFGSRAILAVRERFEVNFAIWINKLLVVGVVVSLEQEFGVSQHRFTVDLLIDRILLTGCAL